MRAGADLARVDAEDLALDGRVVQQPQSVIAVVDKPVKVPLVGQPHAHGDGAHHLDVDVLAAGVEVGHGGAEAGDGGEGGLVGPAVRVGWVRVAPDLEGLLDVRVALLQLGDLVNVGQLCDFLAARRGVAAVGFGRCPAEGELLVVAELVEEVGRGVEDVLARVRGEGQVAEVDEAGGLEAFEDGICGFFALAGSTVEEL